MQTLDEATFEYLPDEDNNVLEETTTTAVVRRLVTEQAALATQFANCTNSCLMLSFFLVVR